MVLALGDLTSSSSFLDIFAGILSRESTWEPKNLSQLKFNQNRCESSRKFVGGLFFFGQVLSCSGVLLCVYVQKNPHNQLKTLFAERV